MPSYHIGVPILDIIFVDDKPTDAVVGGAVLNTVTSLVRSGSEAYLITSMAKDRIAVYFEQFLKANNIPEHHIARDASCSLVSLAFRAAQTEYDFRGTIPFEQLLENLSDIVFTPQDILHFGDFFVFDPAYRLDVIRALYIPLRYLDANVRAAINPLRAKEVIGSCDVLRCSEEDWEALFAQSTPEEVLAAHANILALICTSAANARLSTRNIDITVDCPPIPREELVSTIGAGDNFNAGVIRELLAFSVTKATVVELTREQAIEILRSGIDFAQATCRREEGYVDFGFTPK